MSTLDELEYYCREENVYGALMFVGGWGSGKTYLIENVLAKILENEYIFIRISLFGVSNINDINQKVRKAYFQEMLLNMGGNVEEMVKELPGVSEEAAEKLGQRVDKATGKVGEVSGKIRKSKFGKIVSIATEFTKKIPNVEKVFSLNPSEYISVENEMAGKKLVLVFDDLERCTLDEIAVLGCINEYCENKQIKTIIVANEEKIIERKDIKEEKKQIHYSEIKEKIVIRTIKNIPDFKKIFEQIIQEYKSENEMYKKFLKENLEILKDLFVKGDIQNIRSIKCAIQDFERIYVILKDKGVEETIKIYYQTFLAYTLVLKTGKINKPTKYGNLFEDSEVEKMYPIYYNKKYMIEGVREWLIHGEWNEGNINMDIDRSIKINQAEEPQEIVKESLLPEIEDEVIKEGFPIVLQMAYSGDLSIEQYINLMKNFIYARELAYDLPECIDYDKLNNGVEICLKRMCESDIEDTRVRSRIVNQDKLLESEQKIYTKLEKFRESKVQMYAMNKRNFMNALREKNMNKIYKCENKRYNVFDEELAIAVAECFNDLSNSDSYIFEQIFMEMWDFERKSQDLIKEDSRDGLSRLEKELGQSVETTFTKGLLMKSAITRKFMTDVDTILESIS
mgnify:FL=1